MKESRAAHEAYLEGGYWPELDGLRAISILLVICVHMRDRVWECLEGRLGVTIFFVISGYLITTLALREERLRGSLQLRSFFVRRAFRLLPLYYSVLLIYCVLILGLGWSPEKREGLVGALRYYLLYLQEWPLFMGINGKFKNVPFTQSWSLGVEEKFYLIWAFLGFVAWRQARNLRLWGTVALASVLILSSAAVETTLSLFLYPHSHILIGCVLAIMLDDPIWFGRLAWLRRSLPGWLILGIFLALHVTMPPLDSPGERLYQSAYAISVSLLLAVVLLGKGPIQWLLRRPVLVTIGKLSYGMYLIQMLAIRGAEVIAPPGTGHFLVSALALLTACALSMALAELLAVMVERPGIRVGRRLSDALLRGTPSRRPSQAAGRSWPEGHGDAPLSSQAVVESWRSVPSGTTTDDRLCSRVHCVQVPKLGSHVCKHDICGQ